jgi:hypothetical protein
MITVNGRYAGISAPKLSPANMTTEIIHVSKNSATLRVDDRSNLDFWLEANFDREDLIEMLRQMDESEE